MSDVDNMNLTDIVTLKGKKISQLEETNIIENHSEAYVLLTIKLTNSELENAEPIYVNKKITVDNFLHILLGDDNVMQKFINFFEGSNIVLSNYVNGSLDKSEGKFKLSLETINAEYAKNTETGEKLLSPGLVDHEVMENYVTDVADETKQELNERIDEEVANIMQYINLDEDEVIDTLQEIIDWFNGWRRSDDKLQNLINTILGQSSDYTDNKISELHQTITGETTNAINALDVDVIGGNDYVITSVSETNGKIAATPKAISDIQLDSSQIAGLDDALSNAQLTSGKNISVTNKQINCELKSGTNITVDDTTHEINCNIGVGANNSITVSGTTFTLTLNNGELNFGTYTAITISSSSGGSREYGTTLTDGVVNFKITTNKAYNTVTWYVGSNTTTQVTGEEANTITNTSTSSTITVTQNGNNTLTRTCKVTESDGNAAPTKTISLTFNTYGVFYFGSSSIINSDVFTVTNGSLSATSGITLKSIKKPTLLTNTSSNSPITTSITETLDFGNENLYVYLLIPKSRINSNFKFWMGGDLPEDENLICDGTIQLYNGANVPYNLYRSLGVQTGTVSVKYGSQS